MKKKNILTTGEFARLCKTTKATLFHYDQENLLKPKHVSENGYRRYGVEQFFDFDMITMLKETGSSLKEVGAFMRDTDGEAFLSLLEDKLRIVKKERVRLALREKMLNDMTAGTREALDFEYDTFVIRQQAEERLEAVATAATLEDSTADFIERFAEYAAFYDKQDRIPRSPFGVILGRDDVVKGQYLERYYFSRATRVTPHSLLHVKPEGRYAVLAHRGTVETHLQTFGEMLERIKEAGLTVAGNCYCYDMMSYVLLGVGNRYAAKYCIQVV